MRMMPLALPAAALVVAVAAFAAPAARPAAETTDFEFRTPLLNGLGVDELSDLRGKPVLVEFWGTR